MRVTVSEIRVEIKTEDGIIQGAVLFRDDRRPYAYATRVPPTIGFRAASAWVEDSWAKAMADRIDAILAREDEGK